MKCSYHHSEIRYEKKSYTKRPMDRYIKIRSSYIMCRSFHKINLDSTKYHYIFQNDHDMIFCSKTRSLELEQCLELIYNIAFF